MAQVIRRAAVRAARSSLSAVRWNRYHHNHRVWTRQYLASLREQGHIASPAQRRACRDYSHDVLGAGLYAPWLEVYTATQGEFREGWMPDDYFGRWVVPRLGKGLRLAAGTKSLSRRLLRTDALPDAGYVIAGRLYDRDMQPCSIRGLPAAPSGRDADWVFKADRTLGGMGVRTFRRTDLDDARVAALPDGVLQHRVRQHPVLARIYPDAVGTVRLTTVKEPDGAFGLRAANLKVGLPGREWLEWYYAVRSPVIDDDGLLASFALDDHWRHLAEHPATGALFEGVRIPAFAEARRLCLELHARVPQVGLVGWDVTIDEDGQVVLLEWNVGHPGITVNESTTGPCFTGLGWERFHLLGEEYVPSPDQP